LLYAVIVGVLTEINPLRDVAARIINGKRPSAARRWAAFDLWLDAKVRQMMTVKHPNTWIVVADGARGRLFKASNDMKKLTSVRNAELVAPSSRQRTRELKSDKPGRSYSSSRSGIRHALEPPHDYHKLEKHRFIAALADILDSACLKQEFDDLVLVLPRRSLGELRSLLPKRVQDCVRQEIAKDLTNETPAALLQHLAPRLRSVQPAIRQARP
jgi:protein required for attachment to host cells